MKLLLIYLISNILGLGALHEAGYKGAGMTIAVIDAGFFRADQPDVFLQEQIVATYDLVAEDRQRGDTTVTDLLGMFDNPGNYHGAICLSTMLYQSEIFTGTAPDAHYILIRSEDIYSEYKKEVNRLARAFRMADSLDVDIISVSLGYNVFDDTTTCFTYADMIGRSEAAQAAQLCARHGRLVCVSAGNDGDKAWHYISTPGDADSILTVGATTVDSLPASFSSYGPSADGRIKPEVAAPGKATTIFNTTIKDSTGVYVGAVTTGNGTSFACPEIAGMCACLWSALPQLSAMEIRQLVIESATLITQPDAQLGYGIPNATLAWQTATASSTSCSKPDEHHSGTRKLLRNGRMIIIKNDVEYDILGRIL